KKAKTIHKLSPNERAHVAVPGHAQATSSRDLGATKGRGRGRKEPCDRSEWITRIDQWAPSNRECLPAIVRAVPGKRRRAHSHAITYPAGSALTGDKHAPSSGFEAVARFGALPAVRFNRFRGRASLEL